MNTIIPAKDIGSLLYDDLKAAVKSTMPDATELEYNKAVYDILVALSVSIID